VNNYSVISRYSVFSFLFLFFIHSKVQAAGFALLEQNVTNLGTAYAGTASLAEDASTNFYNPAGLVRLNYEQLVAGGTVILPQTKLHVNNSLTTQGTPVTPSSGVVKPSNTAFVPLMHYANRLNDCWVFGLSVVSTFGSKTNYKSNSIVRYTATQSEMFTIDLGPSIAYQFTNGFSLGAGIDAVYTTVKLDAQFGTGNVFTDGFTKNRADRWGYGYHIGGLYQVSDCTRFGLHYRSKVGVDLKGDSSLQTAAIFPNPSY
jgi:long-chain fatty acid transport protein